MLVRELIQYLKHVPPNANVYLDDTKMPTPLGLVKVDYSPCRGFDRNKNKEIQIDIVTLSTYK